MKYKAAACLIVAGFFSGLLFSQAISGYTGTWEGKLEIGIELRVIFHIKENGKGGLQATADSPDQSAYGLTCDTIFISEKGITIEMHDLRATYTGKLVNDSTMDGTFTQSGSLPLLLKKVDKPTERKRIQALKKPFPYYSYDVEYDNADKSAHFGATLTVPKPDSNINYIKEPEYPVAILITGSGQQDRDETLMGHKPFAVIADYLTRNGFAVLRVDDRGIGQTKADYINATSADFAKDVEAGIDYLKTRRDIDKNKIGLIGHSEGGMIAPMVASHRPDIRFIVLLAGPGIRIIDLMAEQNAALLKSAGVSEDAINKFLPVYKKTAMAIVKSTDSVSAKRSALKIMDKWMKKTDTKTKEALGFSAAKSAKGYIDELYPVMSSPWFRYFLLFDPQPYLRQLTCNVLALNGSRDIQVIASSNLSGIEASLKKSKVKSYEVKEMPGLNHLFQHCTKCTVNEYGELEETFSPEVLQIMVDWLNKNVN